MLHDMISSLFDSIILILGFLSILMVNEKNLTPQKDILR
jgi:hypothetical protein